MSPQPVEVDIAVGIGGGRAAFRLETMACVDPWEFVKAVQEAVEKALDLATDPAQSRLPFTVARLPEPAAIEPPREAKDPHQRARERAADAI